VNGANVRCKLPIAPQFKVPHHFIERLARGRAGRVEDPGALGATPTSKTLPFNPNQFPVHDSAASLSPTLSDRMPSTRLPSKDAAFSFRVAYCLMQQKNRHAV